MIIFPTLVDQLATRLSSPLIHSALISVYTCTEWEAPSVDVAVKDRYENGSDCFTRSVGWRIRRSENLGGLV